MSTRSREIAISSSLVQMLNKNSKHASTSLVRHREIKSKSITHSSYTAGLIYNVVRLMVHFFFLTRFYYRLMMAKHRVHWNRNCRYIAAFFQPSEWLKWRRKNLNDTLNCVKEYGASLSNSLSIFLQSHKAKMPITLRYNTKTEREWKTYTVWHWIYVHATWSVFINSWCCESEKCKKRENECAFSTDTQSTDESRNSFFPKTFILIGMGWFWFELSA